MKNIFTLCLGFVLSAPLFASAATIDELKVQVAQLQAQIALMQQGKASPSHLTALYTGSAPASVSFSAYSTVAPANGSKIGILFGDGALSQVFQRPECVAITCDSPDLFSVHSYMTPHIYTVKLVEYSGCSTDESVSGVCLGQTPKLRKILDVISVPIR